MASADLVQYNADTYDRMWRFAHFIPPDRTPWWPLMKIFAQQARDRLEIGPGPWPKLPVEGTHVVDLSAPALELLARQGALVHRGLLHEIGFPVGAFDLVGLFEVLEHVPDDTGLLHELGRITRPGGRLVVSVPLRMDFYNAFDRWAGHVRRYEPEELLEKLAQAGFVIDCFEVRPETGGRAAAVVLACGQLLTAARIYELLRFPPSGNIYQSVHRWSGRAAILLTLPVGYHCVFMLGFETYTLRVLIHSLLGSALYGAVVAKVLILRSNKFKPWVLPIAGGLLFSILLGLWLTSALWFFTVAQPAS